MAEEKRRREVVSVDDGSRLELLLLPQEEAPGRPVVLCLPAMGVQATYYEPFARELHQRGFHVALSDLRGHGASSVRARRGVRFGYHEMVSQDWRAVVSATRQAFPGSPLFLLGHSLGGQLSALYLGLGGQEVAGLILVASCSVYYRGYGASGGVKVLLGTQLAAAIGTLWGYFPGRRLKFAGNESAPVMRDWARQARTGRYAPEGAPHDYERLLGEVQHPVLAITVDHDWLAPPRAVEHLLGKMPRARVSRWHYSAAEAGGARIDHFRWVRAGAPVARQVQGWVEQQLGAPLEAPRGNERAG